jgi:FKBP-type peptidyl-prolyl cis-trans isomerase SlyD
MNRRLLTFHYTLKDDQGRILDTSQGSSPTPFIEGAGQIIDGLEESLLQMKVGEKRAVVVSPERGYGQREDDLVQKVPKARLPVEEVKVGDQFQTGPDRHAPTVTVMAIEGDEVLLDANHPLAGQQLHFDVELVAAREATREELAQVQGEIVD